jgi:hypothetical protein
MIVRLAAARAALAAPSRLWRDAIGDTLVSPILIIYELNNHLIYIFEKLKSKK